MKSELLFYTGAVIAGVAVLLGLITVCVWKIRAARLSAVFDEEYGQSRKKK